MNARASVISHQIKLSEATHPLLIAYLCKIRKCNGIHNKIDALNENARMLSEINYLCEHNLLFFLTITGQFELIRELFQDRSEMKAIIALLYDIEREQKQAVANQEYFQLLSQIKQTSNKEEINRFSGIDWGKVPHGINAMMMYQYYEQELKHLTHDYHVKQTRLYVAAANQGLGNLKQAIERVDKHPDSERKAAFRQELLELQSVIEQSKLDWQLEEQQYNLLKVVDVNSSQRLHEKGKKYFDDVAKLGDLFEKYKDLSIPGLEKITNSHNEMVNTTRKVAKENEKEFTQQKEQLIERMNSVRDMICEDIHPHFDTIISHAKDVVTELPTKEKEELISAVSQLENYQSQLKRSGSYEEFNHILSQCAKPLSTIQSLLPLSKQHELEKDFQFLSQQINLSREVREEYEDVISENLSELELHSVQQESIDGVTPEEKEKNKETTARYRFFMQAQQESVYDSEEHGKKYKEVINNMMGFVQELKENFNSEPEVLEKALRLEKLLDSFNSSGASKVIVDDIQKIFEIAGELSAYDPQFDEVKSELSTLYHIADESLSFGA